jgi:hypothetical protein
VRYILPSVLDWEAAGVSELVGQAGFRHGTERRPAQVEVNGLGLARAWALVSEDHCHRAAGARLVAGALHLENEAVQGATQQLVTLLAS